MLTADITLLASAARLCLPVHRSSFNIAAGERVRADLKNLDVTYLGSSLVNALGGEATLREPYVTFSGDGASP